MSDFASRARRLRADGEYLTVSEWSDRTGLTPSLIRQRKRQGWSDRDAVTVPDFVRHDRIKVPTGHPGSVSWFRDEWEDDDHCWYVVSCHPDGLTLEQIAGLMGVSDERVRQIELSALNKLRELPEIRRDLRVVRNEQAAREALERAIQNARFHRPRAA